MPAFMSTRPLSAFAGCVALAFLLAVAASAQTAVSLPQQGRWLTESGNFEVDIAPCGPALCGTVARVLANRSMSQPGAEMVAADSRRALGMTLLSGFVPSGEGEWKGQIYNRENGKTYSALMTQPAPDQLVLHAYVGLPMFGKTQVWRRVAENAPAGEGAAVSPAAGPRDGAR